MNKNTKKVSDVEYVDPEDVTSPKWRLKGKPEIIYEGGVQDWCLARINWITEGKQRERLAVRWNGGKDGGSKADKGNPTSSGWPTWFVLPDEIEFLLSKGADLDKMTEEYKQSKRENGNKEKNDNVKNDRFIFT